MSTNLLTSSLFLHTTAGQNLNITNVLFEKDKINPTSEITQL